MAPDPMDGLNITVKSLDKFTPIQKILLATSQGKDSQKCKQFITMKENLKRNIEDDIERIMTTEK